MKRVLVILLVLCLIITGCSSSKEIASLDVSQNEKSTSVEENDVSFNNLIITEIDTKYDDVLDTDDDLVDYMESVDLKVDELVMSDNLSKKDENTLKNTFITITDFIFYDGEIKGKKFSDLTSAAKEKIIDIYVKIDSKIESKFPNYKENIKSTSVEVYTNVVDKAKELKEKIKQEYKDHVGEDNYNDTMYIYEEDKQNVKDVYESYKPYIETGKEKVKSAYENIKEKLSLWYREFKEES